MQHGEHFRRSTAPNTIVNLAGSAPLNPEKAAIANEHATHEDAIRLATEVLLQAIRDVFGTAEPGTHGGRHVTNAKSEAYTFLTATYGEWRMSRRDWCDQAGIDPDSFERGIAARLRRHAITASTIAATEVAIIVKTHEQQLAERRARRERNGEYLRNNLSRQAKREAARMPAADLSDRARYRLAPTLEGEAL